MYQIVLVPLDGSPFSEHALPFALSIAQRAGASVHLVHVHHPWGTAYPDIALAADENLEEWTKHHEQAYLDDVVQRLKAASPVRISSSLVEGEVPPMIRASVTSIGADLVVMTTHGRGPLGRFWLGSVANEVVRDVPVPLLLIRPHDAKVNLSQESAFKHVLLPLDGSALAEQMLEPAVALGSLTDADYTLLRVIRPPMPWPMLANTGSFGARVEETLERLDKLQEDLIQKAAGYLNEVAERLRRRGVQVKTHVTVAEAPAAGILHEANAPGVDLIALETHGRRGLSRLLPGSVADKIIRGASVPVLVQRPVFT